MSDMKRRINKNNSRAIFQQNQEEQPTEQIYLSRQNNLMDSNIKYQNLQLDVVLRNLKKNRQNLSSCFDIYEVLFKNDIPQRCTLHNNFITLYCENQHKLLCVNCIYGSVTHKLHSVVPVKNAFNLIGKDNELLRQKTLEEIEKMKKIENKIFEDAFKLESDMNKILNTLKKEYESINALLEQKYINAKNIIIDTFDMSRKNTDQLQYEISWLRKTYLEKESNLSDSFEQRSQIFNHIILSTLIEFSKSEIQIPKIINSEQLNSEILNEFLVIRQFLQNPVRERKRIF